MFLFKTGRNKKDNAPKIIVIAVWEPQRIHPYAKPMDLSILYNNKTTDIAMGKTPIPPLVKDIAREPATKVTNIAPIPISLPPGTVNLIT